MKSIPEMYARNFWCSYRLPRPLTYLFERVAFRASAYASDVAIQLANTALRLDTATNEPAICVSRLDADSDDGPAVHRLSCADAEPNFDLAYRQLLEPRLPDLPPHVELSAYHDDAGDSLFVRKSYESSTALTLQTVRTEDGLTLPPGTIVGIGPIQAKRIAGSANLLRGDHEARLQSVHFNPEQDAVVPLRLSAWAFREPIDQAIFAAKKVGRSEHEIDLKRLDTILGRSLDDFRALGSEILDICGVR